MPVYESQGFAPPAPLARVSLRNDALHTIPDVPMLIDSAADVTLVPRLARVSRPAAASFVPAVNLDLLFLGRAFKGRFLIIDQAWGILGRDVLNHVAIVLDGPRLSWSEHAP